ncbi:MAG: ATP synthase F0, B subunit [Candidatus Nomurabacteria bacterium GW2011_GWF2_35_12]|uniref:ATP synthase subunit b n=2 Tax=Candidatus Nomuraibacteriota TaxID=1752729 RepID=A0A0G0EAI7_9BACT|nr:MAG: ATP synthase F0, B subunit [Candidatus Nomurabacteria bacterium GW2011_GWF2_35_12]KKP72106.1 MAG: ATP synthase F0, B subunit [Candidatus Nomurabacteria bacterium GW2011_GWB1_35_20]KKP76426.1 MAG: ATP synthase F0, B subunit [Parcubacteria group bacterium GW2011_GWC1_35_21]KKP85330.1 MAG: ATP synthase F0, B subunit [Parcubacteria group bacterium GW2011_GWD2_35_7]KKP98091.1 MAG: ATP synthase F0, B subunit [Candidatus Nomurabacteria bacterium GW2011_GWA1_36_15]HCY18049.1 ATP synthase F0 su
MESIINTFHIDLKIIIAQIFNFGIVFVVLYLYALKPLNKLMKERSEKIEKGINDAKSNAEILNNTKVEYQELITKARKEADKIFQEGKKEAETKKTLMLEKAKEEVAVMIANGKKNFENEKIKMVAQATEEIVSLSVKIAEKILGNKIDESFEEKTMKELNKI